MAPRFGFPFDKKHVPKNGIYILFEKGETGHGGDRIVRVGTHKGPNQLPARLEQHFLKKNKDRSIFRKNIGRSLLNAVDDPYLGIWDLDMTSRKGRIANGHLLNPEKQDSIEDQVSAYIQSNLSFAVIEVGTKEERLDLESKLISTVSLCKECGPSSGWFGLKSPKQKIRESGLWLVNELYKEPLSISDLDRIRQLMEGCSSWCSS
jgi:hypothetical protein